MKATTSIQNMATPIPMCDLSVIVLTFNEARHIERCIRSAQGFAKQIFIIDSGSTDDTVAQASKLGATVLAHRWVNHAKQFNWALDNAPLSTQWVMRLDADEYPTVDLVQEITERLDQLPDDVSGIYLKRRVYFLGSWIKHGGYYPARLLRIWRNGLGRCEERWMDEHMKIRSGKVITLQFDLVDDNRHGLTWWTAKHNAYATREAIHMLNLKYKFLPSDSVGSPEAGRHEQRRRWIKEGIYSKFPPGLRALFYFLYRYLLRLGFLDGVAGAHFHVLQGFWYRYLVDVKIFELETRMREQGLDVKTAIRQVWELDVG
jgi:glycosyltransferase involved in cell wall biosynthesis